MWDYGKEFCLRLRKVPEEAGDIREILLGNP